MRIILDESGKSYEVKLIPRDVKIAKQLINDFLNSVKTHAEEKGAPTLLFTTLIMMHVVSQDQLKALTPQTTQIMLNAAYAGHFAKQKTEEKKAGK